jgi:Ca2+-binding EF-hand superfamily protein
MQHKKLITILTFLSVIGSMSIVYGTEISSIKQFEQVDRNGNKISFKAKLIADTKEQVKDQFDKADMNGDGALSLDELIARRSAKGHLQIQRLFDIADTNSNGFLDFGEFKVMREKVVSKIRERFGAKI